MRILSALSIMLAIAACGAPEEELADQQATEETDPVVESKADSLSSTSTYYRVRPDYRKCMAPLCGGYWVKRVNFTMTTCADGKNAAECYVAWLDLAPLKLTGTEEADTRSNVTAELFRGKLGKLAWNGQTLGTFSATEAWRNAASGVVATGTTYRVDPNPIKCIKAPCPAQYHEAKLNSTSSTTIYGFAGPHAAKLASALQGPDSLLVAGVNKTVSGKKVLEASQFWTRIVTAFSPTSCTVDADCTTTVYSHVISSAAECYCRICPSTAANLAGAELYHASWEKYCSTVKMICPMVKCMATTAACTQGVCTVVVGLY